METVHANDCVEKSNHISFLSLETELAADDRSEFRMSHVSFPQLPSPSSLPCFPLCFLKEKIKVMKTHGLIRDLGCTPSDVLALQHIDLSLIHVVSSF